MKIISNYEVESIRFKYFLMKKEYSSHTSVCNFQFFCTLIKLFLLRGWWMSIIPTRHICVLPKLQFCAGNNPGRENRPIKARKESRPFNWILKTFLPGLQHAHMCDLLFHSTIEFLSGINEICRKRKKKRIEDLCENLDFFFQRHRIVFS